MLSAQEQFIHELQRSQWLSAQEISRNQQPLVERLVRHAATQTDFYATRLRPLFAGPDFMSAATDLSRWSEVPVLRRADAIDYLSNMKARVVPEEFGGAREGASSGSTGRPLQHIRSAYAVTVANYLLERIYELFDVDLNGSLAHITLDKKQVCPYPSGSRYKRWNFQSPGADLFVLDIGATALEQLDWLQRVQPDHVMTYPETLREVAHAAQARNSPLKLRTFISTGETLIPETRAAITDTFGCRVIDIYGAREIGPIAFECPDENGYHVCAEALKFELLDDEDQQVPPGNYGRVVVTSFYNYAMPFIRYDIGDYALAASAPCSCGRGLPWVPEIAGRTRNLFLMPDGSRKRGRGALVAETAKYLSYRQVQFVQAGLDLVQIKYVPDANGAPANVAMLTEALRREFHNTVSVQLVPVDRIERGAGMKLEQFVSLVAN